MEIKFEVSHEWEHGPELLISYYDGSEPMRELKILEPILEDPSKTGTACDEDGNPLKKNKGIFFCDVFQPCYADCSPTSQVLEAFIEAISNHEFTPNSAFQACYSKQGFNVLFSAYKNGDYYEAHRDRSKLTVLYWLGEKNFEGGDLYLPDFDYTIPYEQNKLIMIPSHYRHEVTKISTDQEGFVRYCASAFIN